jgi:hypothetical protein
MVGAESRLIRAVIDTSHVRAAQRGQEECVWPASGLADDAGPAGFLPPPLEPRSAVPQRRPWSRWAQGAARMAWWRWDLPERFGRHRRLLPYGRLASHHKLLHQPCLIALDTAIWRRRHPGAYFPASSGRAGQLRGEGGLEAARVPGGRATRLAEGPPDSEGGEGLFDAGRRSRIGAFVWDLFTACWPAESVPYRPRQQTGAVPLWCAGWSLSAQQVTSASTRA